MALVLALAPTATADHLFATDPFPPFPERINLLFPTCGGARTYTANKGFYVRHGWLENDWDGITPAEKNAFMSPATTFELRINGVLQKSAMHALLFNVPSGQFMTKTFVTEDHDGLPAGTYTFEGKFFLSGAFSGGDRLTPVLAFTCTSSVTFT